MLRPTRGFVKAGLARWTVCLAFLGHRPWRPSTRSCFALGLKVAEVFRPTLGDGTAGFFSVLIVTAYCGRLLKVNTNFRIGNTDLAHYLAARKLD